MALESAAPGAIGERLDPLLLPEAPQARPGGPGDPQPLLGVRHRQGDVLLAHGRGPDHGVGRPPEVLDPPRRRLVGEDGAGEHHQLEDLHVVPDPFLGDEVHRPPHGLEGLRREADDEVHAHPDAALLEEAHAPEEPLPVVEPLDDAQRLGVRALEPRLHGVEAGAGEVVRHLQVHQLRGELPAVAERLAAPRRGGVPAVEGRDQVQGIAALVEGGVEEEHLADPLPGGVGQDVLDAGEGERLEGPAGLGIVAAEGAVEPAPPGGLQVEKTVPGSIDQALEIGIPQPIEGADRLRGPGEERLAFACGRWEEESRDAGEVRGASRAVPSGGERLDERAEGPLPFSGDGDVDPEVEELRPAGDRFGAPREHEEVGYHLPRLPDDVDRPDQVPDVEGQAQDPGPGPLDLRDDRRVRPLVGDGPVEDAERPPRARGARKRREDDARRAQGMVLPRRQPIGGDRRELDEERAAARGEPHGHGAR